MTNENKSKDRLLGVWLLIVIALAFAAALLFRRSAGILAMTPIALLLCCASAFIPLGIALKAAIFGITVFSVNSIESGSSAATVYAALCILACVVFGYGANAFKAKKKRGIPVICAGAVICILLNVFFVGNPFKALSAKQAFEEYAQANYPQNENAVLGEFEFSKIYYRYDTKAYVMDVVSSEYPTEGASFTLGNSVICDGFKSKMEQKIAEQYVASMAAAIRNAFPNGDFEVSFERFVALPEQAILSSESGELAENVCYEIYISGIQTREAMMKAVREYINAIDRSGVGYARLTFKSGIGNWQRRYVAIDPNHPLMHPSFELLYTNTATTSYFQEYLLKFQSEQ